MSYDTFVHWGAKIPIRKVPWRLLLGDRSPWLAEAAPVRVSVTADALCPPRSSVESDGVYLWTPASRRSAGRWWDLFVWFESVC